MPDASGFAGGMFTGVHARLGPLVACRPRCREGGSGAMLQAMTTEEIADAVEARKPWRNIHCRIFGVARTGAFTWFVFWYLPCAGLDILWNFAVSSGVLAVELRTNRYTLRSYSTVEIVGYLMKRVTVEPNNSPKGRVRQVRIILLIAPLFGFVLRIFDAPVSLVHVFYFSGLASLVFWAKNFDPVTDRNENISFIRTRDGGMVLKVGEYIHAGAILFRPRGGLFSFCGKTLLYFCLLTALACLFVSCAAGMRVGTTGSPGAELGYLFFAVAFPVVCCLLHEIWRFRLVQDEIDRMIETAEQRRS